MMKPITLAILAFGLFANAQADVWKWTDQFDEEHFVTSDRPIYTWLLGSEIHFSDKPEHPDARPVELVWHSRGTLEDLEEAAPAADPNAVPGETPEEAEARRAAEAYYCGQASEILDTYNNAPQLYRTGEDGERYYLTVAEEAEAVSEAQAGVDEFCH